MNGVFYFMCTTLTRTYDSYHFGLSSNLTNSQFNHLIRLFNEPTKAADSVLGGRTSVSMVYLKGIGSVVVKYYSRGGLIRYLVKRRYLRCGKTRYQVEYELLQKVRRLGVNAPEPIAYAYQGSLFYKGWLVTREIKQQKTLAELNYGDEEHMLIVMNNLVDQVSTLIENNIFPIVIMHYLRNDIFAGHFRTCIHMCNKANYG